MTNIEYRTSAGKERKGLVLELLSSGQVLDIVNAGEVELPSASEAKCRSKQVSRKLRAVAIS